MPKSNLTDYDFKLTCEYGSRYYFFNLKNSPPIKNSPILLNWNRNSYPGEDNWYIVSLSKNPNFDQEPSIIWGNDGLDEKKYLNPAPFVMRDDIFKFATYFKEWEVNRNNMKALVTSIDPFEGNLGRTFSTATCQYGFITNWLSGWAIRNLKNFLIKIMISV